MVNFQSEVRNDAMQYLKAYQVTRPTPDFLKFVNNNYLPNADYNIRIEGRAGQLRHGKHELENKVTLTYRVIITNTKTHRIEHQETWFEQTKLSQIEYSFSYAKYKVTNIIKAWNNE